MKAAFAAAAAAALALAACSTQTAASDGTAPSLRDTARIALWQTVASLEAGLGAAAACAESGVIRPETAQRLHDAAAIGYAGAELVRLGVALSEAVAPAAADDAQIAETAAATGQVGGALQALDALTRATACAAQVRAAVQLVDTQAALRFESGARPPLVAFDDAALQIAYHLTRLEEAAKSGA